MPKVLEVGPYKFYFYSRENEEPPHIHVRRERSEAKFWLEPFEVEWNRRFPRHELNKVAELVQEHRVQLLEEWYAYFDQA
ncbi:MAG: DUF4160 domain-containing protein [Phycisphaeraceae bacterium]